MRRNNFQPISTYWDNGTPYTIPISPTNPSTLYLTDPANQQYAAFDLDWGGALASLRYKAAGGVFTQGQPPAADAEELVWGNNPVGMVQYALWTGNRYYNPTQAGDIGSSGSALYGAACKNLPDGTQLLLIHGTMREYWQDVGTGPSGNYVNYARAGAVFGNTVPQSPSSATNHYGFSTPYALTMVVRFVRNPASPSGTYDATNPQYYLKLDYYLQNVDRWATPDKPISWSFAAYAPYTFTYGATYPCGNNQNCALGAALLTGLYPTSGLSDGLAVGVNASSYLREALNNVGLSQVSRLEVSGK